MLYSLKRRSRDSEGFINVSLGLVKHPEDRIQNVMTVDGLDYKMLVLSKIEI